MQLTKETCQIGVVIKSINFPGGDPLSIKNEVGVICEVQSDGSFRIKWYKESLNSTVRHTGSWVWYAQFEILDVSENKELIDKLMDQQRRQEHAAKYL